MFAIVFCPGCGHARLIDLNNDGSRCPRCGRMTEHRKAKVHLRSDDQNELRAALWSFHEKYLPEEETAPEKPCDPLFRLRGELESIKDHETKMLYAAEELSSIKGNFTLEDLEELLPGEGAAILRDMVEAGIVFEPRPGLYHRV